MKGKLKIDTDNIFAELAVYDSKLQRVESALGAAEFDLDPGIYKVQMSANNSAQSQLIEILPDAEEQVSFHRADLNWGKTSMPLSKLAQRQALQDIAVTLSDGTALPNDESFGQLFLYFSSYYPFKDAVTRLNSVYLMDQNGYPLENFESLLEPHADSHDENWCNGKVISLEVGNYRLRLNIDGQDLEHTIFISPKVQTQHFFAISENGLIDYQSMSVATANYSENPVMCKFDPHNEGMQYEACELAKGMLNKTSGLSLDFKMAERMAYGKFENPMLGLYAAHYMVGNLSETKRIRFVATVFENCMRLLGKQTDVMTIGSWLMHKHKEALGAEQAERIESSLENYHYKLPPLLHNSWSILVELSKEHPELLPSHFLLVHTSNHLIPNGPWYSWLYDDAIEERDDIEIKGSRLAQENNDLLPRLYAKLIEKEDIGKTVKGIRLSPLEQRILLHLDEVLPIQFLLKLASYVQTENTNGDNSNLEDEIAGMLQYITPEIQELLHDTLAYLNPEKKIMVRLVLYKLEGGNANYFQQNIAQMANMAPQESIGISGELNRLLINEDEPDIIDPTVLAVNFGVTPASIHIALDGISSKLNLGDDLLA